jgi:hypothetical protein
MRINPEAKTVDLVESNNARRVVSYGKCLLATAGAPRDFYVLDSDKIAYTLRDRVNSLHTYKDFLRIDNLPDTLKVKHGKLTHTPIFSR